MDNVLAERPDIFAIRLRSVSRKATRRDWQRDVAEMATYIETLEGERIVRDALAKK